MSESVAYPSYSKIIALNFSEEHRGIANAAISAGLVLGPGFGMLFGGLLMARFGWRPFFLVLGLASLLWIIPWLRWMPNKGYAADSDSRDAPTYSRVRALAIGVGNLRRSILRKLFELFPDYLAALLSGARAPLFDEPHGKNRRDRLPRGRLLRHTFRSGFLIVGSLRERVLRWCARRLWAEVWA